MSNSPAVTGKSLYIYTYTAISCSDMKAHGNCRQGGFYVQKVLMVVAPIFDISKTVFKVHQSPKQKKPFYPGVDTSPPSPFSSFPEDRLWLIFSKVVSVIRDARVTWPTPLASACLPGFREVLYMPRCKCKPMPAHAY